MAWFFYKSGHLYHNRTWEEEGTLLLKKFFYPFIIYSLIGTLIYSIHLFFAGDFSVSSHMLVPLQDILRFGSLEGNKPLWFLLTLAFVRVLVKLIGPEKRILILSCLFSAALAWLCFRCFPAPYYVGNTFLAFFFFSLGFLLKDCAYDAYVLIASALIYLAFLIFVPSIFDFRGNEPILGPYFSFPIEAAAGIVAITALARLVCRFFIPRVLSFVGKKAMILYVWHWIILGVVQIFYLDFMGRSAGVICAVIMALACCGFLICLALLEKQKQS